uniref:Uncharacterized protein n=1 Tax=Arundo donax TaxID=35708 RepID=A0A0A9C7F5_ARUDO
MQFLTENGCKQLTLTAIMSNTKISLR